MPSRCVCRLVFTLYSRPVQVLAQLHAAERRAFEVRRARAAPAERRGTEEGGRERRSEKEREGGRKVELKRGRARGRGGERE